MANEGEDNLFFVPTGSVSGIPSSSMAIIILVVSYRDALENKDLDRAGRLMLSIMDMVTTQLASDIAPVATVKEIKDPMAIKRIARMHVEQIFKELQSINKIQEMDGDH